MGLFAPNFGPRVRPDQPGFGNSFSAALQAEMERYREEESKRRGYEQRDNALVLDATQQGYRPAEQVAANLPTPASPVPRMADPDVAFGRAPGLAIPETLPPFGADPSLPAFGAGAPQIPAPNRNALQQALSEVDMGVNQQDLATRPRVDVGGRAYLYSPDVVAGEKLAESDNALARAFAQINEDGTLTPQQKANARLNAQHIDVSTPGGRAGYDLADLMKRDETKAQLARGLEDQKFAHQQALKRQPSLSRSLTPRSPSARGASGKTPAQQAAEYRTKRYNYYVGEHDKYGPTNTPDQAEQKAHADVERMFPGLSEEGGSRWTRRGSGAGLPSTLGPVPRF